MRNSTMIAVLATAAAALTLGGCGQSGVGKGGDTGSAKKAVEADIAQWNKQFDSKDTEGLVSHYADDAYFVGPGIAGTDGSTAIRKLYATASTDPAFKIHLTTDKVDVAGSGDMGYARGKFTEQYTDAKTGKVMSNSGSYLTVYKKQDDGSWKAVEDFAAADPDSTKPVPPKPPATRAKMTSF